MLNNLVNFLFLFALIIGCSSKRPQGKTEAETLFLEGEALVNKKRYIAATEKFNIVKSQHPYSYYAIPSELRLADILYSQESFEEAAGSYVQFRDLHPKHERLDYVISRIAQSYDNQTPSTFDRDLTPAIDATRYYRELLEKYPQSPYAKNANERIEAISEKILNKEQYIADFYFKTKNYEAALWRYKYIQENFQQKELLSHVKYRQVLCHQKLAQFQECLDTIKSNAVFFNENQIKELESVAETCAASWKNKIQEEKI